METQIAKKLNFILRLFIIFIINFIWLNFYFLTPQKSLIISLLLSLIITIIISKINNKKQMAKTDKQLKNKNLEQIKTNLMLQTNEENYNLILKLFENCDIENKEKFFIINKNHIIVCNFNYEMLNINALLETLKNIKNINATTITILCINIQENILNSIKKINNKEIFIYTFNDIVNNEKFLTILANQQNCIEYHKNNTNLNKILNYALNKKNAKNYLISAILLLTTSWFVSVTLYYLIISTILLLLSLFSTFNKKYNSKQNFMFYIKK